MNIPINEIILGDCMDVMKDMPDDYIDLAIVDPEYRDKNQPTKGMRNKPGDMRKWSGKPKAEFFNELFRISKNQIIWGGNNFIEYLTNTNCFIIWNKRQFLPNFSDCEMAWTSFQKVAKIYEYSIHQHNQTTKIHPNQKPVALYRWLLQNYAKPGQLILDTHSGSGSCACACHLEKFDFIAIEKDPDYHRDSVKRLEDLRAQGVLF